jgi:hypothetical protein
MCSRRRARCTRQRALILMERMKRSRNLLDSISRRTWVSAEEEWSCQFAPTAGEIPPSVAPRAREITNEEPPPDQTVSRGVKMLY